MTDCLACGRRVTTSRETCVYCGATLPARQERAAEPPPLLPSTTTPQTLICPRCRSAEMIRAQLAGLALDRCPQCRGLWLSGPTFDYLIERQAERALQVSAKTGRADLSRLVQRGQGEPTVVYLHCPVCNRQMSRGNYAKCSGIIFDRCLKHGVWLDDEELQQILTFIKTGGHELAKALREEAKQRARLARLRTPDHHLGIGSWGGYAAGRSLAHLLL